MAETMQSHILPGNSIRGRVSSSGSVRGTLNGLEKIQGYSAYEVAVINGFEGTVEEWLASLKGANGNNGRGIAKIEQTANGLTITYTDNTTETIPVNTSVARVSEITLPSGEWVSEGNLHSQVVAVDGVTENSQVDITPSAEQLAVFYEKDLAFVTENDGGVVTVYAIGQKPESDYTFQVTITEVDV